MRALSTSGGLQPNTVRLNFLEPSPQNSIGFNFEQNLHVKATQHGPDQNIIKCFLQGRVPWNLAAAGLLPPDPGALAHPYPGYPAHPPVGSHPATSAYASPHLLPQVGGV